MQWPQPKHRPIAQPLGGLDLFGIRRNGQARRTWTLGRRDAQPGIEGDDTGGIGEQWVDVELANLWVIGGQLAKTDQHFDNCFDIRRWFAAIALQELPNPCARHQPARNQCIQRWQLERRITHDLDRNAALAERDQRPERRIFDEPYKKLDGTRAPNHWLNEKPIEASLGMRRLDPLEHFLGFSPDPVGAVQVEGNPADIALMRDVR